MPALVGNSSSSGKTFESEREILYQILFDLRRDVTELKRLVNSNIGQMQPTSPSGGSNMPVPYYPTEEVQYSTVQRVQAIPDTSVLSATAMNRTAPRVVADDDIQDTEEYVEESLSLNDLERETIRKALERHHGRRRNAAKDLNISERTLYRKIKDYGLD
jgi:DNA-binding protein Fis